VKDKPAHLYFHSQCFDGVVSAALASEYLEKVRRFPEVQLHGVNYDLRQSWVSLELQRPSAVVDFLYHPSAELWVDHHATTFLSDEARCDYEQRRGPDIFYDSSASSCAILLWRRWESTIPHLGSHFDELVRWADRIDSACYDSVDEAIDFMAPALEISLALAMYSGDGFSQHLVWLFRTHSIDTVAARPEVHEAFVLGRHLQKLGRTRLGKAIRLTEDGIAVFDVNAEDVLVNRYAPFHFFPDARYSAGIIRKAGQAKLTAMRNPWIDFRSAPLGDLCEKLGGGGHQRVGSVIVRNGNPEESLSSLLAQIKLWETCHQRATTAVA
jgi:hypothetical protein